MSNAKTFDTWRHTGPLNESERAVLARLFSAGDRLALRHVLKRIGDPGPYETSMGLVLLQGRGWVRMRRHVLELTARFAVEMADLMVDASRSSLIQEVETASAAHSATVAEEKNRRWSISVLFLSWGAHAFDATIPEDWRAPSRLKYEDLLELLRSDGFDSADEVHRAVMAGDRDAAMDLARDAFDGIPRAEILEVLHRHECGHQLRLDDDQQAACSFH